ncbi:MAG: protein kinase, partial [Promethearchaeia archaeon]
MFGVIEEPQLGPALVMELCPRSLRSVLDDHQRALPWRLRLRWLAEIARGMEFLHSLLPNNILHRDLKAANVLFSSEDLNVAVAKIADFGLAVTVGTVQSTSSRAASFGAAGTLTFKAPETFHGKFTKGSDVYAYAVLIFEMVTRRVPFEGLSTQEIHMRVLKHFEYDEDLYHEDGIDEEKQRVRWHRRNPLEARRPD